MCHRLQYIIWLIKINKYCIIHIKIPESCKHCFKILTLFTIEVLAYFLKRQLYLQTEIL